MAKRILVVDDDPIIVKYIVKVLNDNGYETYNASDGVEAFDLLEKVKPDLITLDLQMPEEWGAQFYRRFTKEEEYKDIPVIVISGLPGRHLSIKRAVAFLGKPFDPAELIKIVKNATSK
ncbi:MAG: response regulator [Desulfobacterales bacterium]|nr:response regulator [Desulfobacterales bacterium]